MSKVKYHWRMSPEELMRLASSECLVLTPEKLHEALCRVWDEGWESGWDACEAQGRKDENEIKFNELV